MKVRGGDVKVAAHALAPVLLANCKPMVRGGDRKQDRAIVCQ